MIEVRGLTKRYGSTVAVNDLSCTIHPGVVTGFLGPNGAGKTTTMRLILGLDYPSAGTVTVNGRPYQQLASPMREVGALLDAKAVHGGRSARNHLLCLAQTNGIPRRRVDEVLGVVGLADVAGKRSRGFSLGMSQRLGIAATLLGDPEILMFDEPVNGLDPEGILWIRNLMRSLAAEGRTVLVSSHLMSEMEIHCRSRDRHRARRAHRGLHHGRVHRPQLRPGRRGADTAAGRAGPGRRGRGRCYGQRRRRPPGEMDVSGLTEERIGDIAFAHGIRLHHLALPGLAGAGVHGTDRGQRAVPRRAAGSQQRGPHRNGELTWQQ